MTFLHVFWLKCKALKGDKSLPVLLILIPLIITLLVGGVRGLNHQSLIPIALVDEDESKYSELVSKRFSSKGGINVIIVNDREQAVKMVKNYQVEAAFILNRNFSANLQAEKIEGIVSLYKSPNSVSYALVRELLAAEIIRLASNNMAANWVEKVFRDYDLQMPEEDDEEDIWNKAWTYADSLWEPQPLIKMEFKEVSGTEAVERIPLPVLPSITRGIILFFIMLLVLFKGSWLLEERNNGTMQRISIIPGLLGRIFFANVLLLVLAAVFQVTLVIAAIRILYDVALFNGAQFFLLLAYIFAVTALSMLISTICRSAAQLQAISPMIALLTSFLGGCFWGFLDPPDNIQLLALFTPQGWALQGLQSFHATQNFTVLIQSGVVLVLFGAVLLLIGYFLIRDTP